MLKSASEDWYHKTWEAEVFKTYLSEESPNRSPFNASFHEMKQLVHHLH